MKLSVIIPVYNEELFIEEVIRKVKSVVLPIGLTKEIIIINNGSTDKTDEILEKYTTDPQIKIYHYNRNVGKTKAVKLGIEKATGGILIIQDADLEYNPDNYPQLIEPILTHRASVVYGSRFKGKIEKMYIINRIANIISNITLDLLFQTDITDVNTCYKVFKKEVLNEIELVSKRFGFDTEITAKLLKSGYKIYEVPIEYTARSRKEGKKINWLMALEIYWGILKYKFTSKNKIKYRF